MTSPEPASDASDGAIVEIAPAKINLALHVTGRRADGYHLLDSIVAFADLGERVVLRPSDRLSLSLGGRFAAAAPIGDDNLVLRAARALAAEAGVRAEAAIAVEKAIPAGAGLGGGSADAAATLRGLARLWRLDATADDLRRIGLSLGADVPVCVDSAPRQVRGIGEELTALPPLPPMPILACWPGQAVTTREVFRALPSPDHPGLPSLPPNLSTEDPFVRWLSLCRNDLAAPAERLLPSIGAMIAQMRAQEGCLLARMTGSGSAAFALFSTDTAAHAAARAMARHVAYAAIGSMGGLDPSDKRFANHVKDIALAN